MIDTFLGTHLWLIALIFIVPALLIGALSQTPQSALQAILFGGVGFALVLMLSPLDPMEPQERPIRYCADHRGVAARFLGLSHRYMCSDWTTEDDRGSTETYYVPKKPDEIKHIFDDAPKTAASSHA